MIRFVVGSRSDVGRVRAGNEDSMLLTERLFAVADGMGGHAAGEVASQLALEKLDEGVGEWTSDAIVERVSRANSIIVRRAEQDEALRGMGTTLTLLARLDTTDQFLDERIAVANVGDSRAYVFDGHALEQITDDHTLVQRLVRSGALSEEQAETHPQRNVLTRALGIASDVLVDGWELRVFVGDRFLLCSDGLHGELSDHKITTVLRRLSDPQEAADELVRLANEAGGHDNITVIVIDIVDGASRPEDGIDERERVVAETHGEDRPGAEPEPSVTPELAAAAPTAPEGVDTASEGAGPLAVALTKHEVEVAASLDRSARPRRLTWRATLFVVALLAVAAAAVGAVGWSARNTFYVGFDGGEVVIFRGQPGGVLWFHPTVEERTGITEQDVPKRDLPELSDGKEFGSRSEASAFVTNMRVEIGGGADDPSPQAGSVETTGPGSSTIVP